MPTIRNIRRINKLHRSFIRDEYGSLTDCEWNNIVKEDIKKLEGKK